MTDLIIESGLSSTVSTVCFFIEIPNILILNLTKLYCFQNNHLVFKTVLCHSKGWYDTIQENTIKIPEYLCFKKKKNSSIKTIITVPYRYGTGSLNLPYLRYIRSYIDSYSLSNQFFVPHNLSMHRICIEYY